MMSRSALTMLSVLPCLSPVVVSSFAYTYDAVGRKATETLASGQVVSFGYDFAGQLTSEIRSGTG
ncbi:MAG: RHS repeat protein, partial [Armatimonadetes bacterium]|nr:RHS repeat protein [Armatimonadota bacterium]